MNGRVLSDIEREYEGGNEDLFPGHKPGQALYARRFPSKHGTFAQCCFDV